MEVKIVGPVPEYKTEGSAGADVRALTDAPITLRHMEVKVIPTGIRMAVPEGYEAQVRPRSGLSVKDRNFVIPGTIDSDYRGEVGVILLNLSGKDYEIRNGDRIAQIVFNKVERGDFKVVDSLDDTERGERGFGSTGIN